MSAERIKNVARGRFGAPLRMIYRGVERAELSVMRRIDRRQFGWPTAQDRAAVAPRVTVMIKTFERPRILRRCLASVRTVFDGRVVVVDDSRDPLSDLGPGVDVIEMPFNTGVSKGRNAALDAVGTEFVFVTDDDIVFTAASDLVAAVNFLDDHPEVDLVALALVQLPRLRTRLQSGAEALFRGAAPPRVPYGTLVEGQPVVSKPGQVYLARTASIQKVRWDERLRMVDHRDFFSRASGTVVSVQAVAVRAYHLRTPFNRFYNAYRGDVENDLRTLAEIWSSQSDS